MPQKDWLETRERALENEYFRRKDRELIDRLREQGRKERERQGLEEQLDAHDRKFLDALQAEGITPDNLALLHLAPLIEVAWAEGDVTPRERELVLALALRRGIEPDGPLYQQLVGWLDRHPGQAFFDTATKAIRKMLALHDQRTREVEEKDLFAWATRIAEATGGILGMRPISREERECLRRITTRFTEAEDR
jgi:hypothetical protein